jgi:tRNA dimethylallyltransferase
MPADEYFNSAVQIGLAGPRDALHRRITQRLDIMWRAGLVDEVRQLRAAGLGDNPTARQALGYAQILRFLDGECTEEQAYRETVRKTKRFARGQESWLRRDRRITWLDHDRPDLVEAALAVVQRLDAAAAGW